MSIKNTQKHYGTIAIALHWLVALGFLGAYITVYYRHWFSEGEFDPVALNSNTVALYLHLSFGITVGVFVILRVLWKLMNVTPQLIPGTALEHFAARTMHRILYAVMIIMPITGYMGTKLDTNFFFWFDIPKFSDTWVYAMVVEQWLNMSWEHFEEIVDAIHKVGGEYVVWVLIALHIAAALYHHFVKRDRTLQRMLSTKYKKWSNP